MKNKLIKTTLVLFLCVIMLAGCSVVPSSTPEPTDIPYGEVLDITISRANDDTVWDMSNISKILLEKFSLRVTKYDVVSDSFKGDIHIGLPMVLQEPNVNEFTFRTSYRSEEAKAAGGINYLDYLDKMPNYLSVFHNKQSFLDVFYDYQFDSIEENINTYSLVTATGAPIPLGGWMYNPKWFKEYGYDIPKNIEDMVDLLIAHKNIHPDSAMILCPKTGEQNSFDTNSIVKGVFASYGISYSTSMYGMLTLNERGEYDFTLDDANAKKAFSTVKKIYDKGLLSDENVTYFASGGQNYLIDGISSLDNYALMYFSTEMLITHNDYVKVEMEYIPNQLSMADDSMYLHNVDYLYESDMAPGRIIIRDTGRQEVINRLIDFVDWCCTDEGIIACSLGEKGEHYTVNENGKIRVIKTKSDYDGYKDMDILFTNNDYNRLVLGKYIDEPPRANMYLRFQNTFKDKVLQSFITYPKNSSFYNKLDKDKSKKIENAVNTALTEFIQGEITDFDFESYVTVLENAGLYDFLNGINKNIQEVHEKYKDYLPDSLK